MGEEDERFICNDCAMKVHAKLKSLIKAGIVCTVEDDRLVVRIKADDIVWTYKTYDSWIMRCVRCDFMDIVPDIYKRYRSYIIHRYFEC